MQAEFEDLQTLSVVTPYGYESSSCGYCKEDFSSQRTPHSRASYYAKSERLTTSHYQDLLDRGWRRSGSLLYKPDVKRACCPHYSIRLPAADFNPTKDQRQSLNRWNSYVLGERYAKETARLYPKTKEEKSRIRNNFDLLSAVHGSEYQRLKRPPEPDHRFEISLEADDYTREKYQLFQQYQTIVHKESPAQTTSQGFRNFLCDSPLVRCSQVVNGVTQKLGSYHQCYRLDGALIALAVLDFLPRGVSAVYFIYHQDFERFSFGKLSALREIALALEGNYGNYIMGYYIHSCPKMRYKGTFKPQFVLDPESYDWNPLDGELRAKLDERKYVSLSADRLAAQTTEFAENSSDNTLHGGHANVLDNPREAANSGLSLFALQMPGVMGLEDVEAEIELGEMLVRIRRDPAKVYPLQALTAWEDGSPSDPRSFVGAVAELVACVGPKVAREMIVAI